MLHRAPRLLLGARMPEKAAGSPLRGPRRTVKRERVPHMRHRAGQRLATGRKALHTAGENTPLALSQVAAFERVGRTSRWKESVIQVELEQITFAGKASKVTQCASRRITVAAPDRG
jgi:hypothetical protein